MRLPLALVFSPLIAGCASCRRDRPPLADAAPTRAIAPDGEIEPALVAVDGKTFVSASMHVQSGAAKELLVRVSRDAGATWSEPQAIRADGATSVADPSLARASNGDVFLVFLAFSTEVQGGEPRAMSIRAARAPGDTLVFEAARSLPIDGALRLDKPWSAIDARDRLVVVARWETATARGIDVFTRDGSGAFARSTIATSAAFDGELPTICAGAKKTLVAYVDPDPGPRPRVVAYARADDDGWGAPIVLSNPDEPVAIEAPSCVVSADGAHVVYGLTELPDDSAASPILDAYVRVRLVDREPDMHQTWTVRGALHPAIVNVGVDAGDGSTAVAYYAMGDRADEPGRMTVQFWKPRVRRELPVRARRDDAAWAGDYLAVAFADGTLVVGSIDASSGARRLVFDASMK